MPYASWLHGPGRIIVLNTVPHQCPGDYSSKKSFSHLNVRKLEVVCNFNAVELNKCGKNKTDHRKYMLWTEKH